MCPNAVQMIINYVALSDTEIIYIEIMVNCLI